MDETPLDARDLRPIRSWPELLQFGVLFEEYRLPAHFDMSPHEHETSHGWLILDGGFEQDSGHSVRWRSPGDLEAYDGGTIHRVRVGDRGCRCVVFEAAPPSPPFDGSRTTRGAESIASVLHQVLTGRHDAASVQDALNALVARGEELLLPRREPDWIREADEFIAERFAGSLRAGDVARHVGVHRTHLVREYRRFRGRTIADQVRMLRLAYARNLLDRRAGPLMTIALEAGFADQSHFTREFSSRYGSSPRRYLRTPANEVESIDP